MTVTTPTEDITAPASYLPDQPLLPSRRQDGWTAAAQRTFLEAIAEGDHVEAACARVGLSVASAYAYRRTAKGAAFALGWRAATLVARDAIAETLLVRAMKGQVDTVIRGETVITRHRHDNRLAMSLLARLDRQVEAAPDADVKAARLVAQEFDAFLDLVAKDEGPARAGLFLARRCGTLATTDDPAAADLAPIYALAAADRLARTGVATAAEVDVADLDPAARARWSAEQWTRAEAAGLVAVAVPPADDPAAPPQDPQRSPPGTMPAEDRVWWDEENQEWRTHFPPPPGFRGREEHFPGHVAYQRTLTAAEDEAVGGHPDHYDQDAYDALVDARDAWFGFVPPPAPPRAAAGAGAAT